MKVQLLEVLTGRPLVDLNSDKPTGYSKEKKNSSDIR